LPLRALARLAQNEEPGRAGGDTRSGGGLGEMTRRKREIIGLRNERDFPYLVELATPPGGFRSVFLEIDAFHRERRIPVRRGRSRHEGEPSLYSILLSRHRSSRCIPQPLRWRALDVCPREFQAAAYFACLRRRWRANNEILSHF